MTPACQLSLYIHVSADMHGQIYEKLKNHTKSVFFKNDFRTQLMVCCMLLREVGVVWGVGVGCGGEDCCQNSPASACFALIQV